MLIWLLGSSGMLGSSIASLLKKEGLAHFCTHSRDVDISKASEVESILDFHQPSHIINCAAYTQVDLAEKEQDLALSINAYGPKNLGIFARKKNIALLHFSTDYVFDGRASKPYGEKDLVCPINMYGQSKYLGEKWLLEVCPEACIVRCSWLCGYGGKNFIHTMVDLFSKKDCVKVVDDQVGRPTFCQDLSKAALKLLSKQGIYHYANQGAVSWFDFAKAIFQRMKKKNFPFCVREILPLSSEQYPTYAKRPKYSVLDTKKYESLCQDSIPHWEETLDTYLDTYKKVYQSSLKS